MGVPAVPALAANVSVRVEGSLRTLVPRTAVSTTTAPVNKDGQPGHTCSGTSAAGALEQATGGDWSGTWSASFGGGYTVEAIKGESHPFFSGEYWAIFVNNVPASAGLCGLQPQEGDELLFAPQPESGPQRNPLVLSGVPARAAPGEVVAVRVIRVVTTFGGAPSFAPTTIREPVSGAEIVGAGTGTSGPDGVAQVTLAQRGPGTLQATRGGEIRSAGEPVCVTDGADGFCDTLPAASEVAGVACETTGDDGRCGTADRRAPRAKILSISEGQRFARRRGPRLLRGTVTADPSGLADVRLRLTRNDRGRCATFDGAAERFVALRRCGARRGRWFSAGNREDWSYLLPERLSPGRYVLDVEARDGAGNRDSVLQRTRTRVVFHVR